MRIWAGLPAATLMGGMDFVTTEPAPIMESLPIVTPFKIMVLIPMNTLSPILTFPADAHIKGSLDLISNYMPIGTMS
jgi:hypothetical protein